MGGSFKAHCHSRQLIRIALFLKFVWQTITCATTLVGAGQVYINFRPDL